MRSHEDREIDALVAEHVFASPRPTEPHPEADGCHYLKSPDGIWGWNGHAHEWSEHPIVYYSTEINAAWEIVAKLAPLAGLYEAGDGFFKLLFAEWADHGETEDHPCEMDGLSEDDNQPDSAPWSAHFHIGLMGVGPAYPPKWDHGSRFCARGATAPRAICLAALRATREVSV